MKHKKHLAAHLWEQYWWAGVGVLSLLAVMWVLGQEPQDSTVLEANVFASTALDMRTVPEAPIVLFTDEGKAELLLPQPSDCTDGPVAVFAEYGDLQAFGASVAQHERPYRIETPDENQFRVVRQLCGRTTQTAE